MGVKLIVLVWPVGIYLVAGWIESSAWRRACVGEEIFFAKIVVSSGFLYSSDARSLCKAWREAAFICPRHSIGKSPANIGM
jgi:hypothetical protein